MTKQLQISVSTLAFSWRAVVCILMIAIFSLSSCKEGKDTGKTKESGEVEPDQLNPQLDTRFQEKFFAAQLEKSKDNLQAAYNLFQECLEIDPKSAAAHYEVARIELQLLNNPGSALSHAKSCVEIDKNNSWYHMLVGDTYMALAKYDMATKSYKEVARLNPDDPNILYQMATAQLYAGKVQDAITTYDELEKASGPYEELTLQKHQLYLQMNNIDKAGLELEKLALAYPDQPRYWGLVAQFYQKSGKVDKAKIAMDEMVKSDPDNGQVHYQLSEYYAAAGDDKRSYDELKLAFKTVDISIDQKVGVLLKYLQLTTINPTYLSQAYELLDLTEQLHPTEAKAYSIYGDFLYRDGKKAEALSKYRKAIDLDPSRNMIWEQILVLEMELNDYGAMERDSYKAMEIFPSLPDFYLYNGIANQRRTDYGKAAESYSLGKELVIENDALLARFYSSLGEVYHYQDQHEKSDDAYEQALLLEPNNVFVLNNYAYYLTLRKTALEKAAGMSKKSNELSPGLSSFEDTYAWILYQQGKYADALTWIEKALSHGETNGELMEHHGDILFKLGRNADALEQWKAAMKAGGAGAHIEQKVEQQKIIE